MITAIREVRRARGMTLDDVARACVPPTTAQTIGRLETGTRTVSVGWLNRIAAALNVTAADLVTLPDRPDLPLAAIIDANGAHAPRAPLNLSSPAPAPAMVAVRIDAGVGDYRAGDILWCERLPVEAVASAINRDVLVPRPAGRFAFGRLLNAEWAGAAPRLHLLPPASGSRQVVVSDPPWLARVVRLIREL